MIIEGNIIKIAGPVIVADGNFTITNDTGDILGSISISNFARSPRAGFREIKRLLQ